MQNDLIERNFFAESTPVAVVGSKVVFAPQDYISLGAFCPSEVLKAKLRDNLIRQAPLPVLRWIFLECVLYDAVRFTYHLTQEDVLHGSQKNKVISIVTRCGEK